MSLYVETSGQGPDLVLLHGWGLHGGVFNGLVARLAPEFRLHVVDLPGHGRSPNLEGDYTLEAVARAVLAAVPERARWLGWSLGGRVAMQAALLAPGRVERLLAVAASPRFLVDSDWPGVEPAVLAGFARGLEQDYHATLSRFLAVQARGSERARDEVRALRETLFAHGEPRLAALRGGLGILQSADLRGELGALAVPCLFLAGERDTLMPAAAAARSAELVAQGQSAVITGAGHAPFLSHPDEFMELTRRFLHG